MPTPRDDLFTLNDLSHQTAPLVRKARPLSYRSRLLIDSIDGNGGLIRDSVGIPLFALDPGSLKMKIMMAMTMFPLGEWVPAKHIAPLCEIDDINNGNFRRTLLEMTMPGGPLLSSSEGYRFALPDENPARPKRARRK